MNPVDPGIIVDEFNWTSTRGTSTCRVSIRSPKYVTRVYIEAYDDDGERIHKGITFRPEELPLIIAALQKANKVAASSKSKG